MYSKPVETTVYDYLNSSVENELVKPILRVTKSVKLTANFLAFLSVIFFKKLAQF